VRRRIGSVIKGALMILLAWVGMALVERDGSFSLTGVLLCSRLSWLPASRTGSHATSGSPGGCGSLGLTRMHAVDPEELLQATELALACDELSFIAEGLGQWGGPARPDPKAGSLADFESVKGDVWRHGAAPPQPRGRRAVEPA